MARPTLQLHPHKEPAVAHPAATLLLLRDGPLGVEVLMTRRSPNASFLPGAYVFPGGRVDADDHQTHTLAGGRYRTAALAALRETFEELGILLAVQADGRPITRTHLQVLDRSRALYPQLQAQGWSLAVDQARMLACWTTDRSVPKRFDTVFFAALMPDQQEPVADEMEQFEPVWVRPQDALAQHQAGNFFMIFPTIRTLHWLSAFEQAGQALAACTEDEPLWNSTPVVVWSAVNRSASWNRTCPTPSSRWCAHPDNWNMRWTGSTNGRCPCCGTCIASPPPTPAS